MSDNNISNDIIVIPSISDPRNTVASVAMFQNAFDITPLMPIVIIYGTCPHPFEALGEGSKRLDHWQPPWRDQWDKYRERFKETAHHNGVPVFFFDDKTQYQVWQNLKDLPNQKDVDLPQGIDKDDFLRCVDSIFGATYSYGAQRNKAFLTASNLSSRFVFFFDDDTYIAPHVGNIVERHRQLLERKNVYAVTGGYFGQRAFNASIFRRMDQQQEFMGLLGYEIPDDQATQNLWDWRMADGVLGGNFCLKKEVFEQVCCPAMHRTPTTDDKMIGREIRRVFGRQSHVYKTGWPVIHIHFPHRMDPAQVEPYLRSWAKTKAFWASYDRMNGTGSLPKGAGYSKAPQLVSEVNKVVREFGTALQNLAEVEQSVAGGEVADAICHAAERITEESKEIVQIVLGEITQFETLKRCWPTLIEATKRMNIWENGRNQFLPSND